MNNAKPALVATFLLLAASFPAAADEAAPTPPPTAEAEPAAAAPVAEPASEPAAEVTAEAAPKPAPDAKPAAEVKASATPASAPAPAPEKKGLFRGSTLSYSHSARAVSADKSFEPLWNPYYVHRLSLRPQVTVADQLYVRASLDVGQELTIADDTNRRYELVLSDAVLDVGALGVKDPLLGIQFAASLRVGAGLSKVSQAQTKFLTLGPGVSVARSFNVLDGLSLRYDARYTERFHRSTTSLYEASTLVICETAYVAQCDSTTSSGVRNVQRDVLQSVGLGFSPHRRVSLSAQGLLSHGFLYALTASDRLDGLEAEGTNVRYAWGFNLGASVKLTKELSLNLGASTFVPQLDPSGVRQHPFFHRSTNVYADLGLDLEALLQRL